MVTPPKPTWEHAQSRYQSVPVKTIHKLQSDYFAGRDLDNSVPEVNPNDSAVIVAESLEADIIWNLDTVEVLTGGIKKQRIPRCAGFHQSHNQTINGGINHLKNISSIAILKEKLPIIKTLCDYFYPIDQMKKKRFLLLIKA